MGASSNITLRLLRESDLPAIKASHKRLFSFDLEGDVSLEDAVRTGRYLSVAAVQVNPDGSEQLAGFVVSCIATLQAFSDAGYSSDGGSDSGPSSSMPLGGPDGLGSLAAVGFGPGDLAINICLLGVFEDFRRSGVATRMLDQILSSARDARSRLVFLHVLTTNAAARKFYLKSGFRVAHHISRFYPVTPGHAFLLYNPLGGLDEGRKEAAAAAEAAAAKAAVDAMMLGAEGSAEGAKAPAATAATPGPSAAAAGAAVDAMATRTGEAAAAAAAAAASVAPPDAMAAAAAALFAAPDVGAAETLQEASAASPISAFRFGAFRPRASGVSSASSSANVKGSPGSASRTSQAAPAAAGDVATASLPPGAMPKPTVSAYPGITVAQELLRTSTINNSSSSSSSSSSITGVGSSGSSSSGGSSSSSSSITGVGSSGSSSSGGSSSSSSSGSSATGAISSTYSSSSGSERNAGVASGSGQRPLSRRGNPVGGLLSALGGLLLQVVFPQAGRRRQAQGVGGSVEVGGERLVVVKGADGEVALVEEGSAGGDGEDEVARGPGSEAAAAAGKDGVARGLDPETATAERRLQEASIASMVSPPSQPPPAAMCSTTSSSCSGSSSSTSSSSRGAGGGASGASGGSSGPAAAESEAGGQLARSCCAATPTTAPSCCGGGPHLQAPHLQTPRPQPPNSLFISNSGPCPSYSYRPLRHRSAGWGDRRPALVVGAVQASRRLREVGLSRTRGGAGGQRARLGC